MVEENTDAFAIASEARAKAEARRRRILEKSQQRMGLVSGETSKPSAAENEDGDNTITKSASSNRLQAMRRRRYKKSQQQSQEKSGNITAPEEGKNEVKDVEISRDTVETTVDEITDVSNSSSTVKADPPSEKRKYRGVAAMRRQKLKEKAVAARSATTEIAPKPCKVVTNKLPILLHIFAILILFSVGFKVGIDQVVEEGVLVHSNLLAPRQHGIGLLRILNRKSTNDKDPKSFLEDEVKWVNKESVDEFGGGEEENFDAYYEPNIDPLFKLDLDLYTQGGSFFMVIARCAVSLHRINLQIFYYTPLSIFNAIFRIPAKLMQTPPVLCLVALGIRQFASVLGAALPEEPPESNKKDILGMIKNGVVNYVASSFPTFVTLYNVLVHLRSDLFIILCGLFVGLAWNHHGVVLGDGHDEL